MTSLTYGQMPTREQFREGFEAALPSNKFPIILNGTDSRAVEGFKLGSGLWTEPELWDACQEIVQASDDGVIDLGSGALDVVSCILYILGFEWI